MMLPSQPPTARPRVVAHVSSVHRRADTRILSKECASLAHAGYRVHLIVADGEPAATEGPVSIWSAPKPHNRMDRFTRTPWRLLRLLRPLAPDVIHLHDPELLAWLPLFRRICPIVIYDAHEDVPNQLRDKRWMPRALRPVAVGVYRAVEKLMLRGITAVVAATPVIAQSFTRRGMRTVTVRNLPLLAEFAEAAPPGEQSSSRVCYVGALSTNRGLLTMIRAIDLVRAEATLHIGGPFGDARLRAACESTPGWGRVTYHGVLSRSAVREFLAQAGIGLVLLHPTRSYLESIPVKLLEYMAAGLPVIASDFPMWRDLLRDVDCAVFVDPLDVHAIAQAIDSLLDDPESRRRLGQNGRAAAVAVLNWESEFQALRRLYADLPYRAAGST